MLHNIIVIDDSDSKADIIFDNLNELFKVNRSHRYTTIVSALEGVQMLADTIRGNPDSWVFAVDMQLPLYPHTLPDNLYGGYKILRELQRMGITSPAILVTESDVDAKRAMDSYAAYIGHIKFSYLESQLTAYRELLQNYLQ